MQDVSATNGVSRDLCDDRLGQTSNLDLQVQDVQAPHAVLGDIVVAHVAVVAANTLIASGAKGVGAGAREDDDPDRNVVARTFESASQLKQGLGTKGVAHLRSVDGDPGNAVTHFVNDVAVVAAPLPKWQGLSAELL